VIRWIRLGQAPNCSSLGNVVNTLLWSQAAVAAIWAAAEAWQARRARPGTGGEVRATDMPPALVGTGEPDGPVEAHVAVTRACSLPCPSCHVEPTPDGDHVPLATVTERFRVLAERGVFHVAVGGGEALRHPDLPAVAQAAHQAGLSIGLTTSGAGDLSRATAFDVVNVSFDGVGSGFAAARGYPGAEAALATVRQLSHEGTRVGVNVLLTRGTLPGLEQTVEAAVSAGARSVHLLRLKPAGRAIDDYAARRLTIEEALDVWPRLRALVERYPTVEFRVDCAMVPWLAAHGVDPGRMRKFRFHGCHGGDALLAVDVAGSEHPCSFVADRPDPAWRQGVRAEPCASCDWRDVCRGGCHAVARHVTGSYLAPDPECPRVVGHLPAGGAAAMG
jgi:MoaA/NifB/PqqE/SkfB family radical SAM enzyme